MSYRDLKDESLVMLTLAGEQNAYEALVKKYQSAVLASAMSVTRREFMAEDAAQDAFVTAWMKLDTLNEPEKFGAWVCRIAKNCAKNMLRRYRSVVPLETVENYEYDSENSPIEELARAQDSRELRLTVSRLPEKVKQIIELHYFEGLSIADIADRLRISQGTVKSQLHDGRKKIRKELCAMNEKWNDTLVEKVMKKVAELKLWQLKNSKDGFEIVYKDVLREVEELPESDRKYHALADVLMHGWWWTEGEKNDALFARIKEAAELGRNEDVMRFVVTREDSKVSRAGRIEFIRDKQIPYLEKAGFTQSCGYEWYSLADKLYNDQKYDEALEANAKALTLLDKTDCTYGVALNRPAVWERLRGEYKDREWNTYTVRCVGDKLKYVGGELRFWQYVTDGDGSICSANEDLHMLFSSASRCDCRFFDSSLKVGEFITGSDGTVLTFVSDSETVNTPAGTFEGCALWETNFVDKYTGRSICRAYYKEGVGIVKFSLTNSGITESTRLSSYTVKGGEGLLPLAQGNEWHYADEYDPAYLRSELRFRVYFADGETFMLESTDLFDRIAYDENNWADMMSQVRVEYFTSNDCKVHDVSHMLERAEALARTDFEKLHTKVAASVAKRIMATSADIDPERTAQGYWNFFYKAFVSVKNGKEIQYRDGRWSFELKSWTYGAQPLLCNHIYGMLRDAGNCLWSDEWKIGADKIVEYDRWGEPLRSILTCTDGGSIKTRAGVFENTMKISFDITGMGDSVEYRGGHKEYYFAEGIGIVRMISDYAKGCKQSVYDLIEYDGVGKGYMPLEDGMRRKYEAVGLTDGFYASSEYFYAADEYGDLWIFADKTGVKNEIVPITLYSSIKNEQVEKDLWNAGKRLESRIENGLNDLNIFIHYLGRNPRTRGDAKRAVAKGKYKIRQIESLSEDGSIPPAWVGYYWYMHFLMACYSFGCKDKEEGYRYLELALAHYADWNDIPDGTELELGDPHIFGGIKLVKGKEQLLLPDGRREILHDPHIFNCSATNMYGGMTAKKGWEWFNSAREDELFKDYIKRVKALADKEK